MRWVVQYRVNKYVFISLRKLSLLTLGSLKLPDNARSMNQQQRKPVGRTFAAGVAEEQGVVDWRIWDAAECREVTSETV